MGRIMKILGIITIMALLLGSGIAVAVVAQPEVTVSIDAPDEAAADSNGKPELFRGIVMSNPRPSWELYWIPEAVPPPSWIFDVEVTAIIWETEDLEISNQCTIFFLVRSVLLLPPQVQVGDCVEILGHWERYGEMGLGLMVDQTLGEYVRITPCLPRDANGDSLINALDITKVERIIVGLDLPPFFGADCNGDGQINALDITCVERKIAGLD